tara:strand:- start:33090 stop:33374 length:285 start_codon:yes stop_codon:yes gene_type:complete
MDILNNLETTQVSGGFIFGPAMINGINSHIVMLEDGEDFYYYNFNKNSGVYFKNDGSVWGPNGPMADNALFRSFINQQGYQSFFIFEGFFDSVI